MCSMVGSLHCPGRAGDTHLRYNWPEKGATGTPVEVVPLKGRTSLLSFTLKGEFVNAEIQPLDFLSTQRCSVSFLLHG